MLWVKPLNGHKGLEERPEAIMAKEKKKRNSILTMAVERPELMPKLALVPPEAS